MKNTKIKAALAAVLLSVSGYVFADQDEVNNIASAMIVDTPITQNLDFEQVELNDNKLLQRFENLSVDQKYDVLDIVRSNNMKNSYIYYDKNTALINRAVNLVIKKLKMQGVFITDLSDIKLKSLIVDALNDFKIGDDFTNSNMSNSDESRCPLKIFNDHIDYYVKPTYTSYASPYYYSNVVTEVGEYPCDTELWYNVTKNKVYGLNFSTRRLITTSGLNGYSGRLSKRTSNGKDRIVIGAKKYFWGLSDYALSNNVVIW